MKIQGITIIALALLIPLYWYVPLASDHDASAVLSQYLGSVSLIAMGIVQFLATRARGIESVFGGLDRIYILHKWLAVGAIIAAALHDAIDADIDGVGIETSLTDLAESLGEVGYYGLLILAVVTFITLIPYHYWKWSHRLMGLFFALAALHFVFIIKPFSMFDPPGLYVGVFCLLGIFSYLYLLFPKSRTGNRTKYKVCDLTHFDNEIEIKLKPIGQGIKHKAGQFAFINFDTENLKEEHPFTITSNPGSEREITFTIKTFGTYTANLKRVLKIGSIANVSSAFGGFTFPQTTDQQIWVAAGIGITPFMAWAQTLDNTFKGKIKLYYCNYSADKALYVKQLTAIVQRIDNFELVLVSSKDEKRLSGLRIKHELGDAFQSAQIYFCGPENMRESLIKQLTELGLDRAVFHYEAFNFRSGLGFGKLISWTIKRLSLKVMAKFSISQI